MSTDVVPVTSAAEMFEAVTSRADGQDISAAVKALNGALHGRGGGRNGFAQGSVEAAQSAIEAFFKEV